MNARLALRLFLLIGASVFGQAQRAAGDPCHVFGYGGYRWPYCGYPCGYAYGGYGFYRPSWVYAGYAYRPIVACPIAPLEIVGAPFLAPPIVEQELGLALFAPEDPFALRRDVAFAADEPARRRLREPRVSNAASRERSWRFMEFGDRHFARGDYLQAYERYKLAVEAAPDLVEGYLRRGQSLVALGRYDLAAGTFKYAFTLHPAWAQTDYRLDRIYADRRDAKLRHVNALAAAAEDKPSPELMLLIGAQLYYDGQAERSLKFFQRAKELHRGEGNEGAVDPQVGVPLRPEEQPHPGVF